MPSTIDHNVASTLVASCQGCSAPVLSGVANARRVCKCTFCPNCSTYISTLTQALILETKARIEYYKRRNVGAADLVDDALFIVQDEYGVLKTCQGDLSFLVKSTPLLNVILTTQLYEDIQYKYNEMHLAVWDLERDEPAKLYTKCGKEVVMFPIYVERSRYTVTIFNPAAQD